MSHRKHRRQKVKESTTDYFDPQRTANNQFQRKRSLGALGKNKKTKPQSPDATGKAPYDACEKVATTVSLPAPAFPDQPGRLTAMDIKIDAVDGAHGRNPPAARQSAQDGKMHRKAAQSDQNIASNLSHER
jgi:hypothetical protein